MSDAIGRVLIRLQAWAKEHPTLTKLILLGAAGLGALVTALGIATTAMIAFNLSVLANPLTWILAGIIAAVVVLTAAGVALWANWDKVMAWFAQAWEETKARWARAWEDIKAGFSALWGFFSSTLDSLGAWASGIWDETKARWARAWEDIKAWLGDFTSGLLAIFDPDAWAEAGVKLIEGFWDGLKSIWGRVKGWFAEAFESLTGWLPDWLKEKMGLKVEAEGVSAPRGAPGSYGQETPVAQALAPAGGTPPVAQVGGQMTVRFENAPPGTRVTEIRKSGDVDMEYALNTVGMMP